MKLKHIFRIPFSLLVVVSIFLATACDKVKRPIEEAQVIVSKRKVLLEDYTGHQCGNCPPAAEMADQLEHNYEGRVIVLAVHAGFFSRTNSKYPQNFTTPGSIAWDKFFNKAAVNPIGMVNRKPYGDNPQMQQISSWPGSVNLAAKDLYIMDLFVKTNYSPDTRLLNTSVRANFIRHYDENVSLNIVLAEDSIIAPQTDYRIKPDMDTFFVFRHMLRAEINGTWGETLKKAPILTNDSAKTTFTGYEVPKAFNDKQLYVIVFACDENTKEVLQVERVKILNPRD